MNTPHVMRGKVAKPKVRRPVIEPYRRVDVGLVLNACSNNAAWTTRSSMRTIANERPEKLRDRAIMLVLLDTGLRAQELCNLRMQNFDNRAGKLAVRHGKGDKFRHAFAINFLRNGGSVLELQHMLGHERLETVRIYASLAESDLREAQKRASPADKWNL